MVMCKCTPEIRTPFCGRDGCLPPASREPTESLFAANAEREFARMAHGDHLAQFKADQLDAWERRLAQFSNRSDSTGYAGRIGLEVLAELRQAHEQNAALVAALEYLRDEADKTIVWRSTHGMRPATDISMFSATSLSACIKIKREMSQVLARVRGDE